MPGGLSLEDTSPAPLVPQQQDQLDPIASRAAGLAREYQLAEFGRVLQFSNTLPTLASATLCASRE
jgi:hypothetical protein